VSDRRFDGDDRFAQIKAAPGGARIATLPAPTAAADGAAVRVSPDGRQVAFGSGSDVKLIDFSSDTITVTRTLDATVRSINWSPDGKSLLALSDGNNLTSIYPSTHGAVELDTNTSAPRRDIAWQQLGLVIAPTPQVVGTRASIVFDSSALPPGTTFTCSAGTSAPAPCTSPYQATGLRQIENTVVITAKEPDGRVTTARRTLTVDETAPVARVTAPNYQSSVAATANITVSATDASGVASYDVRYRRASFAAPYSAYIQPWTNTTATTMTLAVAAGYEYCVSVRAKDKLGNIGAWSAERCFSRPLDDRSMSMATTGWARGSSSKFYFGTDTQTTASGKALTRTVQGKRFFLVATRCPSCGAVAVYAGNRLLSTVNLAYPTTHYQVVLGLPVQSTLFSGTLTVRTVSTGKLVQIDGLAVGRT
jgi:WD40 repeat protein